jgi:uncharacterized protein YqgV (UPF0045/DUF77 family)
LEVKVLKSALAIQCLPIMDAPKDEVYRTVDAAIKVIIDSGLPYQVGPFETTVEGELGQLMELAQRAHEAVLATGVRSVITYMKLASGKELGSSDEKTKKYRH